jgi:glycerophosphoryl diester phosphodiesterase
MSTGDRLRLRGVGRRDAARERVVDGRRPREHRRMVKSSRRTMVATSAFALLLAACARTESSAPAATAGASTTAATSTPSTGPPTTEPPTTVPTTTAPARARTVEELLELGRPIVLAHTGGEDQFPASTMFAFGESMKAGVDMLDLNVQLTHDGVLIVHHDEAVDGATNGSGKVADLDYAAIRTLDDAYWFTTECVCKDRPESAYLYRGIRTGQRPPPPGYTPDDFAVPTLRELIGRYPDAPLNIEVKGTGQAAIAAARELISELNELGRIEATVISSFDDTVIDAVRQMAPSVEVSPGLGASSGWVLSDTPLPTGQRILQLPPRYEGVEVLTPDVIARSHAAGYVIWVWPDDRSLENASGYASLLAEGMDGLNINFPATGVAAVQQFVAGH